MRTCYFSKVTKNNQNICPCNHWSKIKTIQDGHLKQKWKKIITFNIPNLWFSKKSANLSASIAEPSSKSSSTMPTADSFFDSLLAEPLDLLLNNSALSLFCFLGGGASCMGLSGGIMSTTMHVVSSFSPLVLNASFKIQTLFDLYSFPYLITLYNKDVQESSTWLEGNWACIKY